MFKGLFREAAEIAGRGFPTETAARDTLTAFRTGLYDASTPVDSVMRRVFARATVREVADDGGEKVFKIFLHSEPAERSIVPVIRGLRAGDLEAVARALKVRPAALGSREFHKSFAKYARDMFPDTRLAEETAAAVKALPATMLESSKSLRAETLEELMRVVKRDAEVDRLLSRMSKHLRVNPGFRYASTFFVLSGVVTTTAGIAGALHEQAKAVAGCWRIYLDPVTRELKSCKILQASCRNRDVDSRQVCDRTPVSFASDMCRGAAPGDNCVRCDSTADPGSSQYIAQSQYLEPDDLYVCKPVASVGEMLGRLIRDIPGLAEDVVSDVTGTVSRVWNSVQYFILAGGGIILAILMTVFLFARFNRHGFTKLTDSTSVARLGYG